MNRLTAITIVPPRTDRALSATASYFQANYRTTDKFKTAASRLFRCSSVTDVETAVKFYVYISVGNRLNFHNQSSDWQKQSMIVGRGIDIIHHSIRDIDQNLHNADVVLYRRHCDICISDFSF